MIIRKFVLLSLLAWGATLYAGIAVEQASVFQPFGASDRIIATTIPKCGTFMLSKCLTQLGLSVEYKKLFIPEVDINYIRQHNQLPPPNHYKGRLYDRFPADWWFEVVQNKETQYI